MEPLDYTRPSRENCEEHRQHKRVKRTYSRRTNSQPLQATSNTQALLPVQRIEIESTTPKNTSVELPKAKKRTIADFFGPASKTPTATTSIQSDPSSSGPFVHFIPLSPSQIPISPPPSSPLRAEPEKRRQRRRLHYKPQHIHELDDNMPSPQELKDGFYKNVHEVAAQAKTEASAEAEAKAAAEAAAAESLNTEQGMRAGGDLGENHANTLASRDNTLVDTVASVDIGPTGDTGVKRKSSQVNRYAEYKPNSSVSIKDDLSVDVTGVEPSSPPRCGTPGKELLTYGKVRYPNGTPVPGSPVSVHAPAADTSQRRKIAKDVFDGHTGTFFDADSSGSSKHSGSGSSLSQVKKMGTPLFQSTLNIGQRNVFITCKDCDFKYNRINRQDFDAHNSYHADVIHGVNLNSMNFFTGTKPVKKCAFTYNANDGLEHIGFIVNFDATSDKKWRVKVETAIKKVERALNVGSPLLPHDLWSKVTPPGAITVAYGDRDRRLPRFVVYCALSANNVTIALLVCERVTRATIIEYAPCSRDGHTTAEDGALGEEITEHKEVVQGETVRNFMGVHYIWTQESYRRLGLATKLLDYARDGHFVKGCFFDESEIAWTNFTEAGQGLAGRYLTGDHVVGRSWETNIYNSEL